MVARKKMEQKEEASYMGFTKDDIHKVLNGAYSRKELIAIYKKLFGKETKGSNGKWLKQKIAYELQQKLRYPDGEPDRVKARHKALGDKEPEAQETTKGGAPKKDKPRDERLPKPGTILEREYGGKKVKVKVNEGDFHLLDDEGEVVDTFKSLSGAAREITKGNVNGFLFFGLIERKAA